MSNLLTYSLAFPLIGQGGIPTPTTPQNALISNSIFTQNAQQTLTQNFSPALIGPGWDAMLAALAAGDQINIDNASAVFNQLFLATASGEYLLQRASDIGLNIPFELGMSDDNFRELAISYTYNKVTKQSLEKILEIFYTSEASRASAISAVSDNTPYNLNPGDTLNFVIDGTTTVNVVFQQGDFITNGAVLAVEVATAINRVVISQGLSAFANFEIDPSTNYNYVRIYSPTLGLGGSIQVIGGTAQSILQFPSLIPTTNSSSTQWNITNIGVTAPGNIRYTYAGLGPNPSLWLVQTGFYVNMANSGVNDSFNSANIGTFNIVNVGTTWFEVFNPSGVIQNNVSISSLLIFNPLKNTIYNEEIAGGYGYYVPSYILDSNPDQLFVYLPATSPLVTRGPLLAAYLQTPSTLSISQVNRTSTGLTTFTTTTNHGLSIGQQILVDGIAPSANSNNTMALTGSLNTARYEHTAILLNNGQVLIIGGFTSSVVVTASCELYNPTTGVWTTTGNMNVARAGHCTFLLDNGNVLVCGGQNGSGTALNSTEIYNVSNGTWSVVSNLNTARYDFSGTILGNDRRILVTGGWNGTSTIATTEYFDQTTQLWTVGANLFEAVCCHATVYSSTANSALVIGGSTLHNPTFASSNIQQIKITGGGSIWTQLSNTLLTPRMSFTYQLMQNGYVFIAGGLNGLGNKIIADAELYPISSPNLNVTNITSPSISAGIFNFIIQGNQSTVISSQSCILSDGNVLISPANFFSNALYNINSNSLMPTINLPSVPASYPVNNTITTLQNGLVLFAGGLIGTTAQNSSYLYSEQVSSGHFNGIFEVTGTPSNTTFTVNTPNYPFITQIGNQSNTIGTITIFKANIATNGPYAWDVGGNSPSLTSITTTLSQSLVQGESYTAINVANASSFKAYAPGFLVFNFGSDQAVYPVPFVDAPTSTTILLSGTYKFPFAVPNGADVTLLDVSKLNFVPSIPQSVGSLYITASTEGRVEAQSYIDGATASGVPHLDLVVYPNDYGMGNWGQPTYGVNKISDIVGIYAGDNEDDELEYWRDI